MDYGLLGTYFSYEWEAHKGPISVWNDHWGAKSDDLYQLYTNEQLNRIVRPWDVAWNYPGGQKCYEPGKGTWSPRTVYKTVCP